MYSIVVYASGELSNRVITKDSNDTFAATVDYSLWLGSDTISTATVTASGVSASSSNTTTVVSLTISGGTEGSTGYVRLKITTAASLVIERDIKIKVKNL